MRVAVASVVVVLAFAAGCSEEGEDPRCGGGPIEIRPSAGAVEATALECTGIYADLELCAGTNVRLGAKCDRPYLELSTAAAYAALFLTLEIDESGAVVAASGGGFAEQHDADGETTVAPFRGGWASFSELEPCVSGELYLERDDTTRISGTFTAAANANPPAGCTP